MVSYLSNASNLFAQGFYSIHRWDVASFSLTQHFIGNWSSIAGVPSATLPHETTRVHKASQHFWTCLHFLHFDYDHVLLTLYGCQI